jgi:hypothetical protein
VLLDAGLPCRGILVDHGDFDALFFLQLQGTHAFGGHVRYIDSEIGTGAAVFAGKHPGLLGWIGHPALSCVRKAEEQRH